MKRSKQTQVMVETVNQYLRANKVTTLDNSVFAVTSNVLSNINCYKGFNWYIPKHIGNEIVDVTVTEEIAKTNNGYIQFI